MINLTLSLISLHYYGNSPFLMTSNNFHQKNYNILNSRFSYFFSNILRFNSRFNYAIKSSEFSHALDTAVIVSNNDQVTSHQLLTSTLIFYDGNLFIEHCKFKSCASQNPGGALHANNINLILTCNLFTRNTSPICGAARIMSCFQVKWLGNAFVRNKANYNGAFSMDPATEGSLFKIESTNISYNEAKKWTGGFRIDMTGGEIQNSVIEGNFAKVTGGFFDFSWTPSHRDVNMCIFKNNSAENRAGAVCAFHLMHSSKYYKVIFIQNKCERKPDSISIDSVDTKIVLDESYFDGPKETQIGMKFGYSTFEITKKTKFDQSESSIKKIANQIQKNNNKILKEHQCID
ncbi:hypothetical protein TRFO_10781 [Tritrichomonas foetus]|uniref:Right handed beta helix domain-containing protein n=1 Tax=Tritrichomonas foetus TaxID=1144522 RepID=A0A1J4J6P6_9EUKA|nr:hypothetical protein TRFO_10781 [Tritrichomonas foetus]|eukprot:OHS94864.1 hypothetical protein TRFO_10781 [Tritrichomonas foetus]